MTNESAALAVSRIHETVIPSALAVRTQSSEPLEVREVYMEGGTLVLVVRADAPN